MAKSNGVATINGNLKGVAGASARRWLQRIKRKREKRRENNMKYRESGEAEAESSSRKLKKPHEEILKLLKKREHRMASPAAENNEIETGGWR